MFVITTQDEIGRHTVTRTASTRADIGPLMDGEVSHWCNDLNKCMEKIEAVNVYKKNKLLKLLEAKESKAPGRSVQVPNSIYHPENVSEDSWELINRYMNHDDDTMIGVLMSRHNTEGWSDTQFCCGTQRKKLDEVIKTLYGLRVEF